MNMPTSKGKKDMLNADIIAIGAVKYDDRTGEIEKFKSLLKHTKSRFPNVYIPSISEKDPNQHLKFLITSSYVGALNKSSDVILVKSSICGFTSFVIIYFINDVNFSISFVR